jgi:hypothetical protein
MLDLGDGRGVGRDASTVFPAATACGGELVGLIASAELLVRTLENLNSLDDWNNLAIHIPKAPALVRAVFCQARVGPGEHFVFLQPDQPSLSMLFGPDLRPSRTSRHRWARKLPIWRPSPWETRVSLRRPRNLRGRAPGSPHEHRSVPGPRGGQGGGCHGGQPRCQAGPQVALTTPQNGRGCPHGAATALWWPSSWAT